MCGGQSDFGTSFSPNTSVYPCQYNFASALYSSSLTCCSYQKGKWTKLGNLPKSNALSGIGEQWIEKYYHLASVFKGLNIKTNKRSEITQILKLLVFPMKHTFPRSVRCYDETVCV